MKKVFLILIIAIIPYLQTVSYKFVFDDEHLIVRNRKLSEISDLSHYFFETHSWQDGYDNYYRPMMYASLMLNHYISGSAPWSYHLFNIIFNSFVVLLVFFLAKDIFYRACGKHHDWTAFFAAVLFAIHPLHTEAVANIAGRADVMMTFWVLLGIMLARAGYNGSKIAGWLVGLCALAAGLTKETGFLIMPVICVCDFVCIKNIPQKKYLRARVWISGCMGTAFAAVMYVFAQMNASNVSGTSYLDNFSPFVSLEIKIKTALYLIGKSIKLLFIPFPLSSDYSFAQITPVISFLTFYSAFAIIIISCGLMWSWKKNSTPAKNITEFAILWFFVSYIFSSNLFFHIGTVFAERLLYLASVGFCIAAGWWLINISNKIVKTVMISFILILFTSWTIVRNTDWRDNTSLYKAMLITAPKSAKAHFSAAKLSIDDRDYDTAAKHLNKTLEIFHTYPEAHGLLSSIFLFLGDYSNSFKEAHIALKLNPNVPSAHHSLSVIYKKRGEKSKAKKHYDRAIILSPQN